jgi:hypothetical protein
MPRFEEVQMRLAESAKNCLELYNMQVFIEQFTLDRESKFSLTLPGIEPPFPISATVSFTYDAFQTGVALYEDSSKDDSPDVDTSIELEFLVRLPMMQGHPDIGRLVNEVEVEFPETEPVLTVRETYSGEEPFKEYELSYSYSLEAEDVVDSELTDEIFEELKGILELIYKRTSDYIDMSWYRGEDDPFKGN